MARNIEVKAKIDNPARVAAFADCLSGSPPLYLHQEDTFFSVPRGRLKLRTFSDRRAELIYYTRENKFGPKGSSYRRLSLWFPKLTNAFLALILRTRGQVVKDRFVYFVGQTRIHLDNVKSLGNFVELEVVLDESQTDAEGTSIAMQIMRELDISERDLVECSYIDLLVESSGSENLH